jgi:hypothetical protein
VLEVLTVLAVFKAERSKEKLVESTLAEVFVIIVFLLVASAPQLELMVGPIGFTHLQHRGLECVRRDSFPDRDHGTSPPYSELDATPVTDVNPSFRRLSTSHFRPS